MECLICGKPFKEGEHAISITPVEAPAAARFCREVRAAYLCLGCGGFIKFEKDLSAGISSETGFEELLEPGRKARRTFCRHCGCEESENICFASCEYGFMEGDAFFAETEFENFNICEKCMGGGPVSSEIFKANPPVDVHSLLDSEKAMENINKAFGIARPKSKRYTYENILKKIGEPPEAGLEKIAGAAGAPCEMKISTPRGEVRIIKGFFRSSDCIYEYKLDAIDAAAAGFDYLVTIINGSVPGTDIIIRRIEYHEADGLMKKIGASYRTDWNGDEWTWSYRMKPPFEMRINPSAVIAMTETL